MSEKKIFEIQPYDDGIDKEIFIYENRSKGKKGMCISIDIDDLSESEYKYIIKGVNKLEKMLNKYWNDSI